MLEKGTRAFEAEGYVCKVREAVGKTQGPSGAWAMRRCEWQGMHLIEELGP